MSENNPRQREQANQKKKKTKKKTQKGGMHKAHSEKKTRKFKKGP